MLWERGVINLPPVALHTLRLLRASIAMVEPAATVKLNLPFHRQEHALSCEAASLKTALAAFGLDIPEAEVLRALPFERTPRSGAVWGDPEKGFVGNIDGRMLVDGYGVYAGPITKAGLRWRRTEALSGATPQDLTAHLAAGRPVVVWGYVGRGNAVSWLTPEGKRVNAVNGEHTRVVYGFSGPPENPSGLFLIDPVYGHAYWDIDTFMQQWERLGRMAVAVYPYPQWVRAEGDARVWEISKDGITRHWMRMTWDAFERRGGFVEAVQEIPAAELERFVLGPDIVEL